MKRNSASRAALLGILTAEALALSFLEGLIPPIPGMPPGAKPGLSNIITMFTVYSVGWQEALVITVLKAIFAALTRGVTAGLMSLSGGLLSTAALILLSKFSKDRFGYLGISVICAVIHNLGQLLVSFILLGSAAVFGYIPFLILFAVVTGALTGTVLKVTMPVLIKQIKFSSFYKRG